MADDDKSKETEETKSTDTEDKKAETTDELEKWKALARKHEKEAKALSKRAQELEDKDKTESQRAADRATKAEKDASDARTELLKLKVALRKGLTETQAKRLVGETEEDLESDADELLESFKPANEKGNGPGAKPKESLRGGGDPTEDPEEMDPRKLAAMVPPSF